MSSSELYLNIGAELSSSELYLNIGYQVFKNCTVIEQPPVDVMEQKTNLDDCIIFMLISRF